MQDGGRFVKGSLIAVFAAAVMLLTISSWQGDHFAPHWYHAVSTFAVMALLFLVLNRLGRSSARHLIDKNWELAGDKVTLTETLGRLQDGQIATLRSIATAIDSNDSNADGHSHRVSGYAVRIGNALGLSNATLRVLEESAIFHDMGKVWLPDYLHMKEGFLTADEQSLVRMHPVIGSELLTAAGASAECISAVLYHHERYDGSGFPAGLAGNAIPIEARILAVADAFDSKACRPLLRQRSSVQEAVEELFAGSGTRFDPRIVDIFLSIIDEIVRLDKPEGYLRRYFGSRVFSGTGSC
ncbi:MAG TPA: HD domain-containing phosphohydrolase [Geobacterales bacterium]|nr:HD domain-containing phosphohydrolase [Geobacterales bacterium]